MALNAYASLTMNGTALSGDTTVNQIGGVDVSSDHIELYSVHWGSRLGDSTDLRLASTRRILPIRMLKRVDQTTPRFYQALTQNQTIAGEIKIFDNNPEDGSVRHRFTVQISNARVQSIETVSPDTLDPATSSRPPFDVIELVPHTLTYTDEVNSTEFVDQASRTR